MRIKLLFISFTFFLILSFSLQAQKDGYAASNGVEIYYRTFGSGEPLLIINGGPGFNSEGFQEIATLLSEFGYQCILYDQRGTGQSKMKQLDSTTITMDLMVQDLEALREVLGIEQWILFGHSFGGMLANYYTAHHQDRVSAIIHSSSGGVDLSLLDYAQNGINQNLSQAEQDSMRYWSQRFRASNNTKDRRQFNRFLARAYVYNKKHVPQVAERMMQGNLHINRLLWANMRAMNFDTKAKLWSFEKPVLILQGKNDILSPQLAKDAHDVFPNSRLVFIEHCGHYGWLDNREKYISEIEVFLRKL